MTWKTVPAPGSLPDQTGNNGKFLETDGTNPNWQSVSSSPTVVSYSTSLGNTDTIITSTSANILTISLPARASRTRVFVDFSASGEFITTNPANTVRFRVKIDGTFATGTHVALQNGFPGNASIAHRTIAVDGLTHTITIEADTDTAAASFYIYPSGAAAPTGLTSPSYPMQASITLTDQGD